MHLTDLLARTGLSVLDHLEKQTAVPVIDGLQAQDDLIVIPLALLTSVTVWENTTWREVPPTGVELIRGIAGNNPHTLVADPGTCHWITRFRDPLDLGIAIFENTAPAYLVHPEHGGSGVAPGRWLVRRQQERGRRGKVLVAD